MNYYLVDTKLISYWLIQRGSSITELYNKIAEQLWYFPKGQIYLAFDDGSSQYRKTRYSQYKGHRAKLREKKSKEEIAKHKQFEADYIKMIELSKSLPVHILHSKGVEADDLISITVERLRSNPENKIYLLTGDMDYINSVVGNDNVFIINVNGGNLITSEYVTEVYGELLNSRTRFNIHKSIFGDKSDNIKFLRGLGEVKAKELFDIIYTKYDEPTVDEIVAEVLEYIKDKKSVKIHEFHIQDGRTTVKEVLETNLQLADTFLDTSKMTEQQAKQFEDTVSIIPPEYCDSSTVLDKSIELLQQAVTFSYKAERVFNVK